MAAVSLQRRVEPARRRPPAKGTTTCGAVCSRRLLRPWWRGRACVARCRPFALPAGVEGLAARSSCLFGQLLLDHLQRLCKPCRHRGHHHAVDGLSHRRQQLVINLQHHGHRHRGQPDRRHHNHRLDRRCFRTSTKRLWLLLLARSHRKPPCRPCRDQRQRPQTEANERKLPGIPLPTPCRENAPPWLSSSQPRMDFRLTPLPHLRLTRRSALTARLLRMAITLTHPGLHRAAPMNPIAVLRRVIVPRHKMVKLITAGQATPMADPIRVQRQRLRLTVRVPIGRQPFPPRGPLPRHPRRRHRRFAARRPALTFARSPRFGRPTRGTWRCSHDQKLPNHAITTPPAQIELAASTQVGRRPEKTNPVQPNLRPEGARGGVALRSGTLT